jgi:branched-chain amino acid transport system permease protein
MALAALLAFNVANSIAVLVLLSLGLGVIYGMMRVINLAHGEFLMLGAYTTVVSATAGLILWVAMLVAAPVAVGLFGLLVERLFIRFLYGRIIDTMLATWGLSLAVIGLITTIFGNTVRGVSAPFGGFAIGGYQTSLYSWFVIAVAAAMAAGVWLVLRFTKFGLIVRATMQNPDMAAALGVSPPRIYMATFALGSALAGLAGGVLAPVSGVSPVMGGAFIARAFITVLGGGPAIVTGTGLASTLFGSISEVATFLTTPVFGQVALLLAALIMIRILPQGITGSGITGRLLRRSL